MQLVILLVLCSQVFAVEQQVQQAAPAGVPPHVQQLAEQHINHILQHVPQVKKDIKEHKLPEHVRNKINNHINQVVGHVQSLEKKDSTIPNHVQHVVQQAHQHIPQVIEQHVSGSKVPLVTEKKVVMPQVAPNVEHIGQQAVDKLQQVQQHVQQVVQQAHQHIPQAINHHKEQQQVPQVVSEKIVPVSPVQVPEHAKEVIQQIHQHVPQVLEHHHATEANKVKGTKTVVPPQVQTIVEQVQQHVPHVITQHHKLQQPNNGDNMAEHGKN